MGKQDAAQKQQDTELEHQLPQHDSEDEELPEISTIDVDSLDVLLTAMGIELPQPPKGYNQRYTCRCDYVNHLFELYGLPPLSAHTWKPQANRNRLQPTWGEEENKDTTQTDQGGKGMNACVTNNAELEGPPPSDPPLTTTKLTTLV